MADVATLEEGIAAARMGAAYVASTLSGYTGIPPRDDGPDLPLVAALAVALAGEPVAVVAEGRFTTPEQVAAAFASGAYAVVVGTASPIRARSRDGSREPPLARLIGIGIDAGGSATRWSAWGTNGPVAAGEVIPVTGHLFNASERERFAAMAVALAEALKPVLAGGAAVGAVVAGITGMSATAPEAALAAGMLAEATGGSAAEVHVEDDIWIAYHAAFAPGAGHVVYCGTGSIGVHIRQDGTVLRAGGRGMLIDDGGSAFWIGRAALT